ncbi:type II toxin-antitoxin system RelE/ParE family toxin [Pontibacter sp. E15-1]|uniref:type II toxin-antitoxin system RelE/ParE family toxin n=1 Tax=Pontibacter sp. E15-1 TaxID=2919918 RepID=UPI001F502402|nr:type II toxin-antitoxin system RelE/ParE family toxin [Pontibacter sp. E15-1]MCJ8165499.1 type II toxin-antitoxin system RelE/ParE family toxin [Pontibacter sp. E15-1]
MPEKEKAVIWSERATNEYLATLDYIAQEWGSAAAEKFESAIFGTVERIARHPAQFPLVNSKRAIRKAIATSQNSIFFREKETHVEILSFSLNSRRIPCRKFSASATCGLL